MSIYIPPKVDKDLLRSLKDIEQQLNVLSKPAEEPELATDPKVLDRLDLIESRLNSLAQFEHVAQPPASYKNDGNPSRVLHEDGTWMEPLAGIAKAVPSALGSDRTRPTNLVNLIGSMAVTGALSADTVRARRHKIKTVSAYMYNSSNISYTASTAVVLTFNTVLFDTAGLVSTTARLAPPADIPSGYWYIWGGVRWSAHAEGANPWHGLRIEKNSAGTPTTANTLAANVVRDGDNQIIDMQVSTVTRLLSSDHVELYVNGGHNDTVTAVANAQSTPGFGMVYLGS